MRSVLILFFCGFCLSAATGCARPDNGEYDDHRGGGYLD